MALASLRREHFQARRQRQANARRYRRMRGPTGKQPGWREWQSDFQVKPQTRNKTQKQNVRRKASFASRVLAGGNLAQGFLVEAKPQNPDLKLKPQARNKKQKLNDRQQGHFFEACLMI